MKLQTQKIILLVVFFFSSSIGYSQNPVIDSLNKVLQTQKEDSNKVKTLNRLSDNYLGERNFTNANQFANLALALAKKVKFKSGEAVSYFNIAEIYASQKKDSIAIQNFLLAVSVRQEISDMHGVADIYDKLSNYYQILRNIPEGLKYQFKRLKLYEELNDTSGIADSFKEIGFIYRVMKNYPEAERYLLASLNLFEKIGDKIGVGYVSKRISQLYKATGNYSGALKKDSAALIIFEEARSQFDIAWSLASIGSSIEGIYSMERASEAETIKEAGYKQALKNYYAALNIFTMIGAATDSYPVISMYHNIGNVNIKLHDLNGSRYYLEKSLQLASETNNIEVLSRSYKSLSLLDSVEGNYKQAYLYFRKYLVYNDSLVNDEDRQKALTYKIQYDTEKNEIIAKADQAKKDAEAKRSRNIQFFVIAVFLLLAIFFFISTRQKQKAKAKIEKAYEELKSTQQQLIQSEKMASLGELTAGIAHEIQNPLNFVNNFSEVNDELLKELKTEADKGNLEEVKAIANDIVFNSEKINHHGKRADAIVKGMLQHSRTSSGIKEPTDINALTDEYLRLSYHGLRAKDKSFNATMKTDFDESIGKINIIPQDIGRVVLNLINNAFYAVDEKKKQHQDGYDPIVSISTKKEKDKIEIKVKDNGNGIPQKVLDKIFQPFFTTKPTGQGTGLGLSLSYDIVKAHGGELKVETKEGEGSAFIIQLPVT